MWDTYWYLSELTFSLKSAYLFPSPFPQVVTVIILLYLSIYATGCWRRVYIQLSYKIRMWNLDKEFRFEGLCVWRGGGLKRGGVVLSCLAWRYWCKLPQNQNLGYMSIYPCVFALSFLLFVIILNQNKISNPCFSLRQCIFNQTLISIEKYHFI